MTGIVFSSLKIMLDSLVNAVKIKNIVQEIAVRINTCNKLLAMVQEVIANQKYKITTNAHAWIKVSSRHRL